jgi:alkylated DNA nucleotide flippase Atl1
MVRNSVKTDNLALLITRNVPRGRVTTYGDLSASVYGHNRGANAISVMMKAWVAQDPRNWTHRVVNDDGTLVDVELHHARLAKEGVAFDEEGRVVLEKHRVELPPFKRPTE